VSQHGSAVGVGEALGAGVGVSLGSGVLVDVGQGVHVGVGVSVGGHSGRCCAHTLASSSRACCVASGGVRVLNEDLIRRLGIQASSVDRVAAAEVQELERRERLFRGGRVSVPLAGRTVILVDDGLATGEK